MIYLITSPKSPPQLTIADTEDQAKSWFFDGMSRKVQEKYESIIKVEVLTLDKLEFLIREGESDAGGVSISGDCSF